VKYVAAFVLTLSRNKLQNRLAILY